VQPRHPAAREADVAAHAQDGIGSATRDQARASEERADQAQRAAHVADEALAAHAVEGEPVERDPGLRHEPVLHPRLGAEPAHLPAAPLHLGRDGEAGDDVPTGACRHHEQVLHARPPRISCRFWSRHAHFVRFTSLRDMSLAQTGIASASALATRRGLATPRLMRGLRA
jgi:hypothetical protein